MLSQSDQPSVSIDEYNLSLLKPVNVTRNIFNNIIFNDIINKIESVPDDNQRAIEYVLILPVNSGLQIEI